MAEVFRARLIQPEPTANLPEVFALKRMLPEVLSDPAAQESFLTEADVSPMLVHPNMVRVFLSGLMDGWGFLVMELVDGRDLEQIRAARPGVPMPPQLACYFMVEMLEGLSYLHHATGAAGTPLGLIHRDVTPANVFVGRDGCVKLADIGVARIAGFEGDSLQGGVKGKLRYLSPEQVVASELGPETDIFAAGAILFELLVGRCAFDQESQLNVMLAIRDGKVTRLRKSRKELPASLETVVKRAMHHKRKKRYPSAASFLEALQKVRKAEGWELHPDEVVALLRDWVRAR